ncbi:pseudouridine synthase [uncultured Corynebacterium sp.]|uniref:pseudouridine synthase n=1 Tax=uncultured Corynebacterium sp. TaxID=159447 RepID=UPI0025D83FF7|nr:pseudouridine synthase [uncultured Corynebacterium sp.]
MSDSQADRCLDKYIRSQVKGVPATVLFRLMRTKQITVNGTKCKPDQRTVVGDKVRLPALEVAAEKPTPTGDRKAAEQLARRLSRHIVFEDGDLLVVNRPANIAVHVGSRVKAGVIEALRVLRPKEKKLELAHRLDKETSGLLMVAKNSKMLRHLGHPIIGDSRYANPAANRAAAEKGVRMLMLHACRLVVPLPDGEVLDVHAPMPPAWNKLRG